MEVNLLPYGSHGDPMVWNGIWEFGSPHGFYPNGSQVQHLLSQFDTFMIDMDSEGWAHKILIG